MLTKRLAVLEKLLLPREKDAVETLTDIELDAQIERALAQLEEMPPVADRASDQLAEMLVDLRQRGAFPIGAFDEQRVSRLVQRLQMQVDSR